MWFAILNDILVWGKTQSEHDTSFIEANLYGKQWHEVKW